MPVAAINALEDMESMTPSDWGRRPAQVTLEDLENADMIVALKHARTSALLPREIPTFAERVEFWDVDDAPYALPMIERKIMELMARLLGGGAEAPRQEAVESEKKRGNPAPS